jgi:hypothetical protein
LTSSIPNMQFYWFTFYIYGPKSLRNKSQWILRRIFEFLKYLTKSTPIVLMSVSTNMSSAKRSRRQDLPTPESPIMTS